MGFFKKKQASVPVQPQNQTVQPQNQTDQAAVPGEGQPQTVLFTPKIGEEQLKKATETLMKYKNGKVNLEARIIANENWWKLQQWKEIENSADKENKTVSGWLFNTIISKHADAVEAYPTFNCLPREEGDKEEAKNLSSILPVVLEQNRFADTYSDCAWQKMKFGTGVYGIFWDNTKLNGLGDITIEKEDLLSMFWQPGITDLQKSRNIFKTQLVDNELLEEMYPQTVGKLGNSYMQNKYEYDDNVPTDDMSLVIDWYYKKFQNGKQIVHYVRYVNDVVLYATENVEELADKGLYDHGMYPFVFDSLFPVEGSPCGFSYIDVCKNPQKFIDELGQAFMTNAKWASHPRYFRHSDGSVNENEFADTSKMFINADGQLGEDSLREVKVTPINDIYVTMRNNLIEEMKETSGNRDVNNGGAASGVTAASAIAAMQEQSGKTSRDSSQNSYRAYEKIINICIELVRQFYDIPRQFRITGQYGADQFVQYSNAGIKPQQQGDAFGMDLGFRLPVFDLEVTSQKANAYTKISQNELALQFYQLGFFNPQNVDQTLMTLDMMDFDNKNMLMNKISEQGTLYEELVQTQKICLALCQRIDQEQGTNMAEQYAMAVLQRDGQNIQSQDNGYTELTETDNLGNLKDENAIVSNARDKAQAATQPS